VPALELLHRARDEVSAHDCYGQASSMGKPGSAMNKSALRRSVFSLSSDALHERGAEALRLGRFKDATDIFKQLVRQDPRPEWTHRLGDAYAGRARVLAEKDMFKEAAIVLENTLAADGTIREPLLYLSCLIRQGQHQKALRTALASMARLPAPDAAHCADMAAALSLTLPAPMAPGANPPAGTSWAGQICAARDAIQAWLRGSPADEVDRSLRGIALRSPFGAVRLILKSLIGEPDTEAKARALLVMVPDKSAFAGARDATRAALSEENDLRDCWSRLRPAQQQFVAEVRGLSRDATLLLNQIQDAERRGPTALFEVLTRRGLPLPAEDLRAASLNLLPAIPERLPQFEQRFGRLSVLERNRILALAAEAKHDWDGVPRHWCAVVEALAQEAAQEARLARAVVLRHLAELARAHPGIWDDPNVPADSEPVAHYLERSIEADPDCLPATLALLDCYRTDHDPKDWYRAAEAAARRFPGSVAVLQHAVDAAVGRNAYKKAAGFARQVLMVDPINLPVRQRMIELQLAHARKQMRSGRPDLAMKAMAGAAEWERPDAPSAALRIGRALAAMTAQSADAAPDMLHAAVQEAGGGAFGWFHAALEASLMGWPEKRLQPFQHELEAAQKSEPDRTTILALVGLLGQKEIRGSRRAIAPAMRRIEPFLERGSRIAWSSAEFQAIAELLAHLHEFRVLHRYASAALQREAGDHAARFYQIMARAEGDSDRLTAVQESELRTLLQQAGERQDFRLCNRVQKWLFGPEVTRARRGSLPPSATEESVSESEMAELMAAIGASKPILPPKEVRAMVNELGRDLAIDALVETMADSPMADMLSEEQMTRLCVALVAQALDNRPRPARRR
jgi:cellulose synthase operon protein C